jgi:hypothetical protein
MIDKCANPACSATFRSLRDGRVFVKEVEGDPRDDGRGHSHELHYFWLCNSCCRTMTVIAENGRGGKVVPLPVSGMAVRAAS